MCSDNLKRIYSLLRDRYPLILTNTFAVDDGFTEDVPIIVGQNASAAFWLYEYGDDLIFSYEVPGQPDHDHAHPQNVEETVQAVIDFMQADLPAGKESPQ